MTQTLGIIVFTLIAVAFATGIIIGRYWGKLNADFEQIMEEERHHGKH